MFKQIPVPENEAKLLAHWRFDEAEGKDVVDHSGNGYDGTMKNMDATKSRIVSDAPISMSIEPAGKHASTWSRIKACIYK